MSTARNFLFIVDEYETLNLETETSLLLMEELVALGHVPFWVELDGLVLRHDKLFAKAREVESTSPFRLGEIAEIAIDDMDALLVRTDPPFDETYLQLTYLLDFVGDHVAQFNPPRALRSFNEKLTTLRFPDLAPPTLTTMNEDALKAFVEEHTDIVVKPLGECSGRGIQRVTRENVEDIKALLLDERGNRRFVTAQKFLEAIAEGDKRVYLVAGEPVGMVNRIPAKGGWLGNIHQGAKCEKTSLTPGERRAIEAIKPFLDAHDIFLVGLDLIGEKITEINITSPSAIRQINEVSGKNVHKVIVERMLARVGETTEPALTH